MKAPPLGLVPKYLHDEKRLYDILKAMTRYHEANLIIPKEWMEEYSQLSQVVLKEREKRRNETCSTASKS